MICSSTRPYRFLFLFAHFEVDEKYSVGRVGQWTKYDGDEVAATDFVRTTHIFAIINMNTATGRQAYYYNSQLMRALLAKLVKKDNVDKRKQLIVTAANESGFMMTGR